MFFYRIVHLIGKLIEMKVLLDSFGLSVYLDWTEDKEAL